MSITTFPPTPPPTRQPVPANNTLGAVAVILGMVDFVGQVVSAAFAGQAWVAAVRITGTSDISLGGSDVSPHVQRILSCFVFWVILWILSLVPFVIGILGARDRPRAMGVTAIVLCALAPAVAFVVFWCFVGPVANQ